ncbi:MAG: hypothetical protein RIR26_2686, partial [Pseudomonadota bacterium]
GTAGNQFGQLGNASTTALSSTTTAVPVSGTALTNSATSYVVQVVAGTDFTCALRNDGAVYCWGLNSSGQVGDGTIINKSVPTAVSGLGTASGVVSLTAGAQHACALKATGETVCWGANGSGQLGDGSTSQRTSPVVVSGTTGGSTIVALSAGSAHTCAVRWDGTASCWGANTTSGILGANSSIATNQSSPQAVQWSSGVTDNPNLRPQMCSKYSIP